MNKLENIVKNLIERESEEEWFEFKEIWYSSKDIGDYISSLSNAAAMSGKEYGYLIWGVNNDTHELTGTTFNPHRDVKNEPLEHYLARLVTPDIGFYFKEIKIEGHRLVILVIPAATKVPTAFDGVRYLRIGSSKVNLLKFPERESQLFSVLRFGLPTVSNTASEYQDLTFRKLFLYYEDKGIILNKDTFEKNLGLRTKDGVYNILAQLVSDDSHIPVRVTIFRGKDKASPLYSVREFGNNCIFFSLDKVLEYADVINIVQADESNRIVDRKEVRLFDISAFREAIINAFVHNLWVDGNAPMITIFSDRIEILSRGTLAPKQTKEGFYKGESIPVNQALSDMFLQLHISERSGRGVPKITKIYGEKAFEFRDNSIVVNIPFHKLSGSLVNELEDKTIDKEIKLNNTQKKILDAIRDNPNLTQEDLSSIIGVAYSTIEKNIRILKSKNVIDRMGSKKKGYWTIQ